MWFLSILGSCDVLAKWCSDVLSLRQCHCHSSLPLASSCSLVAPCNSVDPTWSNRSQRREWRDIGETREWSFHAWSWFGHDSWMFHDTTYYIILSYIITIWFESDMLSKFTGWPHFAICILWLCFQVSFLHGEHFKRHAPGSSCPALFQDIFKI